MIPILRPQVLHLRRFLSTDDLVRGSTCSYTRTRRRPASPSNALRVRHEALMRTLACLLTLLAVLAASPAAAQTTEMTMYVSVLDAEKRPVPGLGPDDFVVREDGRVREVLRAGRTSDPIELAILIDNSQAMQQHILDLRRALTPFVTRLAGEQANIVLIGMGD